MQTAEPHRGRPWVAATVVAVAALLTVDRLTKILIIAHPDFSRVLLSGWLTLRGTKNPGVAFGVALPAPLLLLAVGMAIIALIVAAASAWRQRDTYAIVCLLAVISGAAANVVDRLRYGAVIDYLDVPWFTVFNIADALITVGVGALIARVLVRRPSSTFSHRVR